MKYKLLVAVGIIVVGNVLIDPLIHVLFPDLYPAAVNVARISLLMLLGKTWAEVLNPYLNAMQAQRYGFWVFLGGLALFLLTAPPLVIYVGITGAAWELVLATTYSGFVTYLFVRRADPELRVPFLSLFRYGRDDIRILKSIALPSRFRGRS